MRYELHVSGYDALDHVLACATVWDSDRPGAGYGNADLILATSIRGEGEADPRIWLQDLLLALLERL